MLILILYWSQHQEKVEKLKVISDYIRTLYHNLDKTESEDKKDDIDNKDKINNLNNIESASNSCKKERKVAPKKITDKRVKDRDIKTNEEG